MGLFELYVGSYEKCRLDHSTIKTFARQWVQVWYNSKQIMRIFWLNFYFKTAQSYVLSDSTLLEVIPLQFFIPLCN